VVLTVYAGAAPLRPLPKYPLIIIGANNEEKQHRRAAKVGSNPAQVGFGKRYNWYIVVSHSTGNLTESFEKACNIWEELEIVVDNNYTWSATVQDTNYEGSITYGALNPVGVEESKLTYSILVNLISNVRWGGE